MYDGVVKAIPVEEARKYFTKSFIGFIEFMDFRGQFVLQLVPVSKKIVKF